MKIPEWEEEIKKFKAENPEDLQKILNALRTLKSWDKFKAEFEWTGVFKVGALINIELNF